MSKLVGVRFRDSGRKYYFDAGELDLKPGMHVIAEGSFGLEFGTVDHIPVTEGMVPEGIKVKPVVRIADEKDEERAASNAVKEKEAMAICREKIAKHGLEMKLIDTEYTFDNNKILFYFTADGRIDFRDLVKDLASVFRTRIELRQIGVRDETKILGGIGVCGRPLCCHTHLTEFAPVSIKMAKEQNLSLNPAKISGACGRLMCCLKNEEATYEYLNSQLPNVGDQVTTITGVTGEVSSINVLRQKIKLLIEQDDEKELQEYHVSEITKVVPRVKGKKDKGKKEKAPEEAGASGDPSQRQEGGNPGKRHEKSSKKHDRPAENRNGDERQDGN